MNHKSRSKLLDLPNEIWISIIKRLTGNEIRYISQLKPNLFTLVSDDESTYISNHRHPEELYDRFVVLEAHDNKSAAKIFNRLQLIGQRTFIIINCPLTFAEFEDSGQYDLETGFEFPYGSPKRIENEDEEPDREFTWFLNYVYQKKILNVTFLDTESLSYNAPHLMFTEHFVKNINILGNRFVPFDSLQFAFPALVNLDYRDFDAPRRILREYKPVISLKLLGLKKLTLETDDLDLTHWHLPQLEMLHLRIFMTRYEAIGMRDMKLPKLKLFHINVNCSTPVNDFRSDLTLPSLEFLRVHRDWLDPLIETEDVLSCNFEKSFLSYFKNHEIKHVEVSSKSSAFDTLKYIPKSVETLTLIQSPSMPYALINEPTEKFNHLKVFNTTLFHETAEPFSYLYSETVAEVYVHFESEYKIPIYAFLDKLECAFPYCETLHVSGCPTNLKLFQTGDLMFHNIKKLIINDPKPLKNSEFYSKDFFTGIKFESLKELVYYDGDYEYTEIDFNAPKLERIIFSKISKAGGDVLLLNLSSFPSLKNLHLDLKYLGLLVMYGSSDKTPSITGEQPGSILIGTEADKFKDFFRPVSEDVILEDSNTVATLILEDLMERFDP